MPRKGGHQRNEASSWKSALTQPARIAAATLGDRITSRLLDTGLSAAELASFVGVTSEAVSQWESGETEGLKPENLVQTAEFLATPQGQSCARAANPPPRELPAFFPRNAASCRARGRWNPGYDPRSRALQAAKSYTDVDASRFRGL